MLWFAATHPGDKIYKPAVQQALVIGPAQNREGREQHISFPPIANQKINAKQLTLKASSDAHVPVQYYVPEGTAAIEGNKLKFTKIPPSSRFPIKVTVVA
ncbi:MAG: hypothetical protein ICV84_18555 [Flavisolibacter sp.]|nr:hypothetical protein [Flavisolibacter sp.]